MDWFSKLFGPVFLTVAISMYIVIQILLRIGKSGGLIFENVVNSYQKRFWGRSR